MDNFLRVSSVSLLLSLIPVVNAAGEDGPQAPVAELKLASEGLLSRLHVTLARPITLSTTKPDGVKMGPADPSVLYGILPLRVTDKGMFVAFTEAADSITAAIYLDANGDGDLTNDPAVKLFRGPAAFSGETTITVGDIPVTLGLFRYASTFAKSSPSLEKDNPLFYHREDVREGKLTLASTTYSVLLAELAATGRYDGVASGGKDPAVALFIDRNDNGQYDRPYEQYDLSKPFTIAGQTYELDRVAADGSRLALRTSAKVVAKVPLPLDTIGQAVPAFEGTVLGGKVLKFPGDYKGKIVLLDFWALGCAGCLADMPELVRSHNRLKERGFEIVGINLDEAGAEKQVLDVCKKYEVTWPNVFEGKGWEGTIAAQYKIDALPRAFLVDGTTGKLLAAPDDLSIRGHDGLGKTIERILMIRDTLRGK